MIREGEVPSKTYAIESNGRKQLEVTWGQTGLSKCIVKLDGASLLTVGLLQAMKNPQEVRLPDGAVIRVQRASSGLDFDVFRDGQPLVPQASTVPSGPQLGLAEYALVLVGVALLAIFLLLAAEYVGIIPK
jgi:hypothetical protein